MFHQSDHINFFNKLCRFRNRISGRFPVTSFIHSISYQQYMQGYLEMAALGAGGRDALICSSAMGQRVLKKCFDRIEANLASPKERVRMAVIPLGIDEDDAVPGKTAARQALGVNADEVAALAFGRFSEVDKMDLFPLLQAFQRVAGQGPYRLILAGSVHSRPYLQMLELWIEALGLSNAVTVLTEPTETDKRALFSAADFFVSLADNPQETFGLTLLEAMWAGLPLLVSDFDGYKELVPESVGLRVPTYWTDAGALGPVEPLLDDRTFHLYAAQSVCVDLERLTVALREMFQNEAMRQEMGKKSRQRFESEYAHRRIIGRLEGFWDALKADFRPSLPVEDWASLDTYNTFSHYVTRRLGDDERVTTSRFGALILNQQGTHPLLPNMAEVINNAAVVAMLTASTTPCSVADFVAQAAAHASMPRYLLLWMLKHGLLALTDQ